MAVQSVALVAHDNKKKELVEWASENRTRLAPLRLYATGTTGRLLKESLNRDDLHCLLSGPLGGDQQIGAKIASDVLEGEIKGTELAEKEKMEGARLGVEIAKAVLDKEGRKE